MQHASQFFTQEQRTQIEQAVADAEAKTSVEIIPVVATASGRYDRPEDIAGLWAGLIALGACWAFFSQSAAEGSSWAFSWQALELPALIGVAVVGFIIGAAIASHIGWLRRLFTPKTQMRDEVAQRARAIFFDNRLHRTAGATGLLLYLSLYERTAMILADDGVTAKLGADAPNQLCDRLTRSLRAGEDATTAICTLLQDAGERLSRVLPRAQDDVNELPNTLVTID